SRTRSRGIPIATTRVAPHLWALRSDRDPPLPVRDFREKLQREANVPVRMTYTLNELMVVAAAREIKDGEVVFVGMRLPLVAFVVAKKTHAPNAVGLFENGVIRSSPSPELIYTMADPPNIKGATQCLDMLSVMGLLQSGKVNVGFLGAAEVDQYGNLNSTQVQ